MGTIKIEDAETTSRPILQRVRTFKFLAILMLIGLVSCNQSLVFEENREMAHGSWHKDSLVVFNPVIEDTSKVFNLGFSLKHNNDYSYSNLWLFVEVNGPGGHQQTDTMEFFLAEPDGRWLGKGNDKTRVANWLYKPGVKLRQPGAYSFIVHQGMRRDLLEGVLSLSMWIEEADLKENSESN